MSTPKQSEHLREDEVLGGKGGGGGKRRESRILHAQSPFLVGVLVADPSLARVGESDENAQQEYQLFRRGVVAQRSMN